MQRGGDSKFKLASTLMGMLYCAGDLGSLPHPDDLPAAMIISRTTPT